MFFLSNTLLVKTVFEKGETILILWMLALQMDTIRHSLVIWSWKYSLMTIFSILPCQEIKSVFPHDYIIKYCLVGGHHRSLHQFYLQHLAPFQVNQTSSVHFKKKKKQTVLFPSLGRGLWGLKKNPIPNADIAFQQWYFQEASIFFVITINVFDCVSQYWCIWFPGSLKNTGWLVALLLFARLMSAKVIRALSSGNY